MSTTDPNTNRPRPTLPDLANLPPTVDIPTAARLLGISRTAAYQLAAKGALPVPVLRLGHRLRVPAAPLLTLLGFTPRGGEADGAGGETGPGVATHQDA